MLKNNLYNKTYLNIINESVDVEKYQQIAKEIGGVYNPDTNTMDCRGNRVIFKNKWLNDQSTFDFKLINTSNNWSDTFAYCESLTHLPDNFTIPEGVTNCRGMFFGCKSLNHLPDNFTIPDSVVDCSAMFVRCQSLINLPNNFTIPNGVECCYDMFYECVSLTELPDNFTIPDSVNSCSYMFCMCKSLKTLPQFFHIPANRNYNNVFKGCINLDNTDIEQYLIAEI